MLVKYCFFFWIKSVTFPTVSFVKAMVKKWGNGHMGQSEVRMEISGAYHPDTN